MKWKKLGKIFDPREHSFINNCEEFAQSPQTLVFDDFIRVYFTIRSVDPGGMFRGHVHYADFTKDFSKLLRTSDHDVIGLGKLGCFDEHGIFPMNPLRVGDKIYGYTSGISRRKSVDVETSIGLAISEDNGEHFVRHGDGPILSSSLYEPFMVGDPFVMNYDDTFYMWYIYGPRWVINPVDGVPERVYKIGYATSTDGYNWDKANRQILSDKIDENECQALPTVIKHEGIYHMIFCYRSVFGFRTDKSKAYRIGYASSTDLINWTRDDAQAGIDIASEDDWDSDMQCYPHLCQVDDKIYLLYNGNKFGRYGFGVAELEK